MKKFKPYIFLFLLPALLLVTLSCEKNAEQRSVRYYVKGLSSEYKVTCRVNGSMETQTLTGQDYTREFWAEPGEVLYFDVKYKDKMHKMSGFATVITVNGKLLKESYGYDIKWADSATVDIPYPFEVILSSTVPY